MQSYSSLRYFSGIIKNQHFYSWLLYNNLVVTVVTVSTLSNTANSVEYRTEKHFIIFCNWYFRKNIILKNK